MAPTKGILERLKESPVIGDGGFLFALEKRGYVTCGNWTSEASVENPNAVRQLHREFLRAGSDVMQTFTFFSTDDMLENAGNRKNYSGSQLNQAACDIARSVADEGDALVAGGITSTYTFAEGAGNKQEIQDLYRKQIEVFVKNKTDFIICEYFKYIQEMEYAIDVAVTSGQPVAATMCVGPEGDLHGVTPGECAVRMAKAGASIVGLNCLFDYNTCLETIAIMRDALKSAGLSPYLMVQPHGYHSPEAPREGYIRLPQFPLAMDSRVVTRFDMHKFAREAFKLGVKYIGGCCGTEPYHIRAMAEELSDERGGRMPRGSDKSFAWGGGMAQNSSPFVRERVGREYWQNVDSSSGQPYVAALVKL